MQNSITWVNLPSSETLDRQQRNFYREEEDSNPQLNSMALKLELIQFVVMVEQAYQCTVQPRSLA